MARSTFYYYLKQSKKPDKWTQIRLLIFRIYHHNEGRYGYRRIQTALRTDYNICINHKTVRRLMEQLGLKCQIRIKKYISYRGDTGKIAPNRLMQIVAGKYLRNFSTTDFFQKLVTDVTEFSLLGVKVYLSPLIDLHNGEVLTYTIYDKPVLDMVTDMLKAAFKKYGRKLKGAILHSDQGWQYQHKTYQDMLKNKGILQSMSRKGNCLDNSLAENFFSQLKAEFLYKKKFATIDEFKAELEGYIKYYNEKRIKSKLQTSPAKYRKMWEESKKCLTL